MIVLKICKHFYIQLILQNYYLNKKMKVFLYRIYCTTLYYYFIRLHKTDFIKTIVAQVSVVAH